MNPAEHTPADALPGTAAPGPPPDGAVVPDGEHPGRPRTGFSAGEREIQRRLGTVERADRFRHEQMLDHLNARMQEFVQRQEMFFLATADAGGRCDNSFRAGPPGFLHVLDERTLVYPEYRGNGVHASLGNILENPHVGILLVDFDQARIGLHVNGRAELVEDAELRAQHPGLPVDPVPGRRAQVWVRVTVEEAYVHCAKHIPHLQKAQGASRAWGTDDYKRKGGDFFGVARQARQARRRSAQRRTRTPVPAAGAEGAPPAAAEATAGLTPAGPGGRAGAPGTPQVPGQRARPTGEPGTVGGQQPQRHPTPTAEPAATPAQEPAPAKRPAPLPAAVLASTPDPAAWRQEAQRALDEAHRRGRSVGQDVPFHGWFG